MLYDKHFHAGGEGAVEGAGQGWIAVTVEGEAVNVAALDEEKQDRAVTGLDLAGKELQLGECSEGLGVGITGCGAGDDCCAFHFKEAVAVGISEVEIQPRTFFASRLF